jgi:hypothetical protein
MTHRTYILKLLEGSDHDVIQKLIDMNVTFERISIRPVYSVHISSEMAKQLENMPGVEFVQRDSVIGTVPFHLPRKVNDEE